MKTFERMAKIWTGLALCAYLIGQHWAPWIGTMIAAGLAAGGLFSWAMAMYGILSGQEDQPSQADTFD